jgi:glycosyltransferase involved in cell wall biosynthesis
MHVHFVVNSLGTGGAEWHTVRLANALSQRGHDVSVTALAARAELLAELDPQIAQASTLMARTRPIDLTVLRQLRSRLADLRADLIVAVNRYPLILASLAAPVGSALASIDHSVHDRLQRRALELCLRRRCRAVVIVCEAQRRGRATAAASSWHHCIHNGIDVERFAPLDSRVRAESRARIGTNADLLIGVCAAFRPEKRHDLAVRAIARLRADGLNYRLLLIGDGPQRASIEGLVASLGLRNVVRFAGAHRDVRPWIGACDMVALPSDFEAFPLATLEAMSMGLAVVASRVGGVHEQIDSGIDGVLVPSGDASALAGALAQLADASRRQSIGQAARAKVLQFFDQRHMFDRYEALFASLAGGQHAAHLRQAA